MAWLTPGWALTLCLLIDAAYVGSLYLARRGARDSPDVIRSRIASTICCALVSWSPLAVVILAGDGQAGNVLVKEVLGALGLAPARPLRSLALPAAHVAVLYAGPLLHEATRQDPVVERIDGYRAHVMALQRLRSLVVSPFVEEFVFRACMLPLLLRGGWSPGSAALLAPVIFGVAHLHHLHDLVVHQGREVGDAVAAVAFQFGYTSLFGAYASLLFLRTRSLGAPLVAHVFCNWMGLPSIDDMAQSKRAVLVFLATLAGVVAFFTAMPYVMDVRVYAP